MTSTPRFGLTLDDALSNHDKRVVDAVLAALELHEHGGGTRVADPSAAPTGGIEETGGRLTAGVTFFYRVAFVDEFGLESAASAETFFTTPGSIPVPSAPTVVAVAGGTLGKGTTYYALSSVDASGNETQLSSPALISITDFLTVQVTGQAFSTGTVQYNVWRQGPRATGFSKIGSITNTAIAFVDDGAVADGDCSCDPSNLPPATNLTNATSKITLTAPDALLVGDPLGNIKSWRIYRATASGNYGKTSLLAEVTETVNPDGTGGLVTEFVDDGTIALIAGQPQEVSQTLTPSVIVEPTAKLATVLPPDTLDDPRNEGELIVLLPDYVLYVWDAAFNSDAGGWRRMTDTRLVSTLPDPASLDRQDGETVLLTANYQLYVFDGTATRWRVLTAERFVTTLPSNVSGDREDGEMVIFKPGYRPYVWDSTASQWRSLTTTPLVTALPDPTVPARQNGETVIFKPGYRPYVYDVADSAWHMVIDNRLVDALPPSDATRQDGETVVLLPDHIPYVWDSSVPGWFLIGGASTGGGGVSGDEAPNLAAPDGHHWLLQVGPDGAMTTTQDVPGGTEFAWGRGPVLTSVGGRHYRMGVESDGGLVTFATRVRDGDAVFASGAGPLLFGTTGTFYRAEVGDDGALAMVAQDDTYDTPPVFDGPYRLQVATDGTLSTSAGGLVVEFDAATRLILTDSTTAFWQVLVDSTTGAISTAAPATAAGAADLLYAYGAGPILLDSLLDGHRLFVADDGTLTAVAP